MLRYKYNVLDKLKESGYSTYKIRSEHLLSESTVQKLRAGQGVGWDSIEILCKLLELQPGDFLEYVPDEEA